MSGPAIHYIVAKEVNRYLSKLSDRILISHIKQEMEDYSNYMHAGTLGPDFLFFNPKDIELASGMPISNLATAYKDVSVFVQEFKEKIDKIIKPIREAKDRIERASSLTSEINDLVNQIHQLVGALHSTVEAKVQLYIIESHNLFQMLGHPIQNGDNPTKWWWFDRLHYRRTGEFAEFLLKKAEPGNNLHAYALGYLTHIASDVVGHPFVNMVAGGPYRYQPQRHKVAESFQDVAAYKLFCDGDFVRSNLYKKFSFGTGHKEGILPEELQKYIKEGMNTIYNGLFAEKIELKHIEESYWYWFKWFKATTSTGTLPQPEPYSLTQELQEAFDTFVRNIDGISDLIPDSFDAGGGGILGIFTAIAAAILCPLLLAAALADFIAGAITTIALSPLRFYISLIYEYLFTAYSHFRLGIALNGLGYPLDSHLSNGFIQHMLDPTKPDHNEYYIASSKKYPHTKLFNAGVDLNGAGHLLFPANSDDIETRSRLVSPFTYFRKSYHWYINGDFRSNGDLLDIVDSITEDDLREEYGVQNNSSSNDPLGSCLDKYGFGNAPDFTVTLLKRLYEEEKNIPNFNLDGDRGIGYKCWKLKETDSDLFPAIDLDNLPVNEDII